MAKEQAFSLIFAPVVNSHLESIESKWDSLIRSKIEEQLTYEPDVETNNRKRFRRRPSPFDAEWEIRFGPGNRFRVLYNIAPDAGEVHVLAVGEKRSNRLIVAGKELNL